MIEGVEYGPDPEIGAGAQWMGVSGARVPAGDAKGGRA